MDRKPQFVRLAFLIATLLLAACTAGSQPPAAETAAGARCSPNAARCNVLGGSSGNSIPAGIDGATVAGGGAPGLPNRVTGNGGTVAGGFDNLAGERSTVAGGSGNTALYFTASVGGGSNNRALAEEATVAGGLNNVASDRFATVGGGAVNTASSQNTTVAGGSGNTAGANYATVGGGVSNSAGEVYAVVSGGNHNLAQGPYSAVGGGGNNTASGPQSTVAGGAGNTAGGEYATIPGGFGNRADGAYSFAAGNRAQIASGQPGAFLFADASPFPFPALAPDEFAVRATGGVRLVTAVDGSGAPAAGVRLSAGSGSWETLSDVNAKTGFVPVDENQILDRLMALPINTWSYRSQDASIRHIGPTAQDFYSAFRLGTDDRYISTVDEEGVALAAVQALARKVQQDHAAAGGADPTRQIAALELRLDISNGLAVAAMLLAILAWWRRSPAKARR